MSPAFFRIFGFVVLPGCGLDSRTESVAAHLALARHARNTLSEPVSVRVAVVGVRQRMSVVAGAENRRLGPKPPNGHLLFARLPCVD
jgi:hypothetical protein